MKNLAVIAFAAALAASAMLAPAAQAGEILINLTKVGNGIADGNAACPGVQPYLYAGGFSNNFTGTAESAYPSPNLAAYLPPGGPVVAYDVPMDNGRFGDSFNLQNTRSVCYAIVQFRTKYTGDIGSNDDILFGHVDSTPTFNQVATVGHLNASTGIRSYAFDATGRALLSQQTGVNLDKAPADSVFDTYLEDDSEIDFLKLYVWYGPNCAQNQSC